MSSFVGPLLISVLTSFFFGEDILFCEVPALSVEFFFGELAFILTVFDKLALALAALKGSVTNE